MSQAAFGINEYKEISKQVLDKEGNRVSVLSGREGMGKSQYALHLVKNNMMNVVFLCMTNAQAARQAKSFESQGASVQLIASKSAKLKEIGINVKVRNANKYFGFNGVDKKRTLAELAVKHGSIEKAVELYDSETYDQFDMSGQYQIICATFAQVHQIQGIERDDWVVMMDDPDRELVANILVVNAKDVFGMGNDIVHYKPYPKQLEKNSKEPTWFIQRPEHLKLTHEIKLPILLTTTESLVADMIVKNLGGKLLDHRVPQHAGDIHVFCTTVTRKATDLLIPIFVENLGMTQDIEIALIGDGMDGVDMTHKTAKGSNDLMDSHTVIDLSHPHAHASVPVAEELGIPRREAEIRVMLDMCHQSIGRNSGYRAKEGDQAKSCYVFVEQKFASEISKRLEYNHTFHKTPKDRQNHCVKNPHNKMFLEIHRFLRAPGDMLFAKTARHYNLVRIVKKLGFSAEQISKFTTFLNTEIKSLLDKTSTKTELDKKLDMIEDMVLQLAKVQNIGNKKAA